MPTTTGTRGRNGAKADRMANTRGFNSNNPALLILNIPSSQLLETAHGTERKDPRRSGGHNHTGRQQAAYADTMRRSQATGFLLKIHNRHFGRGILVADQSIRHAIHGSIGRLRLRPPVVKPIKRPSSVQFCLLLYHSIPYSYGNIIKWNNAGSYKVLQFLRKSRICPRIDVDCRKGEASTTLPSSRRPCPRFPRTFPASRRPRLTRSA